MNYIIINKKLIFSLIIPLILVSLISGPFIPDLILSLSVLYFLVYLYKKKNFKYFNNFFFKTFIIFNVYCVLNSLNSENIIFSLKSSSTYLRFGIFVCFIVFLIDQNKKILSYTFYTFVIIFLILVIDGYYQFFNGENFTGYRLHKDSRVSSFFGDELIMGSYLSRLFPLFFALFVIKKNKEYEKYIVGILFVLVDILIFLSAERTAFFFLNMSTILIIVLTKKFQFFRLVTFIIGLIFIYILTINSTILQKRMFVEPANSMGMTSGSDKAYIFTRHHDSIIKTGFKIFLDKPIFGHGPKMYRVKCEDPSYQVGFRPCSTHPHNFYVQLLAETGVIGFSFLLIAFLYVIFCLSHQLKNIILINKKRPFTDYQICLLACLLITVWPFSPNGNFFNNWLSTVYCIPVGFYLHSIIGKKIRTK